MVQVGRFISQGGGKFDSQGPFVSRGQEARAFRSWFLTWTLKFYGAWTKYIGESKRNGVDLVVRAPILRILLRILESLAATRATEWTSPKRISIRVARDYRETDEEKRKRKCCIRRKKNRDFCFNLSSYRCLSIYMTLNRYAAQSFENGTILVRRKE